MASGGIRPLLSALLLIWLTAQRGVIASDQLEADPVSDEACLASTLEPLLSAVGRMVRAAMKQEVSELDGRLAGLQTQLTDLAARLDRLQTEHETQGARLLRHVQSIERRLEKGHCEPGVDPEPTEASPKPLPRDCRDLRPDSPSGIYQLELGQEQPVPSYCDTDTDGGGWTVFQRRADIQPRQDFFLGWEDYKRGFGTLDAEFWWGLEHLYHATSVPDRRYELRIDMEDFDGEKRFALYQNFRISSEAKGYRLHAANYTGTAGDSLEAHSGKRFSTKDEDHDNHAGSCAVTYKGAWWYDQCHSSNLNGVYLAGSHSSYADGVNWLAWRGYHYSLKSVEMKMRPL